MIPRDSRLGRFASLSFLLGLVIVPVGGPLRAAEKPGAIPGGFSVNDQGVGQYSIPISTPAATGGMRPSLALSYNHLAGDGLAGMRWTLSGFSSIRRCQQTVAQDGANVPVTYASTDRYCLDGQRLVGISGTYHQGGAEYRTEIETFQRIKSYNTAGSGPQYFTVEHGNGLKSVYGYNSDSRIEKVGASDVRIWYISYTEDQFGNRVNYGYDENTSTGEVLPDEVTWTSNSGQSLSARYKVEVIYETRPSSDQRSGYESGGAKRATTQRIDKIRVWYNTTQEIATYDLSYSTSTTGRSQLDDVVLSRSTDTLPETAFTWQDGTVGWNTATDTNLDSGSYPLVGDFNNDGNMDIFVSLSSKWQVYLGNDSGSLDAAVDSGISYSGDIYSRVFDYDGDGDTDLLYKGATNWMVLKSDGDDFAASAIDTGISKTSPNEAYLIDFDGDGLKDWLFLQSNEIKWRRNEGTGFDDPATLISSIVSYHSGPAYIAPPDFNGDGRDDLFYGTVQCIPWPPQPCEHTLLAAVSFDDGYDSLDEIDSDSSYSNVYLDVRTGDINGDGLTDVFFAKSTSSNWKVAVSQGDGIASVQTPSVSSANYADDVVADYNGDGLDDLLRYSSGTYYVYLSTGTTISNSYTTSFSGQSAIRADFNGDGYADLAYISAGDWHIRTHQSDLADVVTSFDNGLGYGVDVTYESLAKTATAHYAVDASDTPSSVHEQIFSGPRYVVTHEDHDDGIGGTRNFEHFYDTAWIDRSGRGWLSFDHHIVYDVDKGTNRFAYFRQDWPYAGNASYRFLIRTSPWQWIQETQYDWQKSTNSTTTPDIHFIRVETTTSNEWEVGGTDDGDLIRIVEDNPTYNTTYGYVTARTVTTEDPGSNEWTTSTTYTYDTYTTPWCIALPNVVTTTNTKPDTSSATRQVDNDWNSSNCSLTQTVDKSETSDTELQLKTTYTYDGYGNQNVVSTDSVGGLAQNRSIDYDYDSWGHAVTSETIGTVSLSTTRTWDYVNAQPASVTGVDGLTTSYDYDSFGRLEEVDTPTLDTDYTYVACTSCFNSDAVYYVKADHSDGNDEYEYFDALNRSVATAWTLPGGTQGRQETVYNALGQVARTSQPYVSTESKYWVSYDYDLIGRPNWEKAPINGKRQINPALYR